MINLETVAVSSRNARLKSILLLALGGALAAACALLRNWLNAHYPDHSVMINVIVILLFAVLVSYLVIVPFLKSVGIEFKK